MTMGSSPDEISRNRDSGAVRYSRVGGFSVGPGRMARCHPETTGSCDHVSSLGEIRKMGCSDAMKECNESAVVMDDEEDMLFPTYEDQMGCSRRDLASAVAVGEGELGSKDDSSAHDAPSIHADYLAHEWTEDDLLASWKYVVANKTQVERCARLQNAAWRSWARMMFGLRTVPVETVGWAKDSDVTWLYGPLLHAPSTPSQTEISRPKASRCQSSPLSTRKPCLRRRSVREVMLSRSEILTPCSSNPHVTARQRALRPCISSSQSEGKFSSLQCSKPRQKVRFCPQLESCAEESEPRRPKPRPTTTTTSIPSYLQLTHISTPFFQDFKSINEEDPSEFDWVSYDDSESSSSSSTASSSPPPTALLQSPCTTPPLPERTFSPDTCPSKPCSRCHLPMPSTLSSNTPSSVPLDICAECIRSILEDLDEDIAWPDSNETFSFHSDLSSQKDISFAQRPLAFLNSPLKSLSTISRDSSPSRDQPTKDGLSAAPSLPPTSTHLSSLLLAPQPLSRIVLHTSEHRRDQNHPDQESESEPELDHRDDHEPDIEFTSTRPAFQPFATLKWRPGSWVTMERAASDEGYGSEEVGGDVGETGDERKDDWGSEGSGREGWEGRGMERMGLDEDEEVEWEAFGA